MSSTPDQAGPTGPYSLSGADGGDLFAGRFKIREKLGEGGMGLVYVADQIQPVQRRVAIKVLKADLDGPSALARFEQERQALALMDHPNIAKVFDGGTDEQGRPFLVMELVKGIPITKYCDQEKLTPHERLELFVPICQAVQHAHQKGIIHRDLKPSNILVALYDGKPVPKVIDFGVAKATARRLGEHTVYTEAGTIVGTLEYMAPEQAELNNLDIDTRADIYSLGVILYQLLTGSPPFTREQLRGVDYGEMVRLLKEVEPPRPSTRLSSSAELPVLAAQRKLEPKRLARLVRGDLDWIVMKCLEKERARRYDTANDLAQDLQHFLHDEPVSAAAPGAGYRLRKFVRRNKGPVLAAALVLLALVGGIIGTTWGLIRADSARCDAEAAQDKEAQQRRAAEAKEREAKDAAAEAKAVLEFFQEKVLAAGGPEGQWGGLGKDVTLRKALDAARAEVGKSFKDRPVVEASVLKVLGDTYWYLGEWEETLPMFERALALREKHLGLDHPDTLMSMHDLGYVYCHTDRLEQGLPLLERTLALKEARWGADHADTLMSVSELAWAHVNWTGQYNLAVSLFERAVNSPTSKANAHDLLILNRMGGLGVAHALAGDVDQSIHLLNQALVLSKTHLGPKAPDTAGAMSNLALAYQLAGKQKQALKLYKEILELRLANLGPHHPYTLDTIGSVAMAYEETGELNQALKLYTQVFQEMKEKFGPGKWETLFAMDNLGGILVKLDRPAEAEPILRECLAARKKKMPGRWEMFNTQRMLGGALLGQKKYTEADPLLLQGYAGLKERAAKIRMPVTKNTYERQSLEWLVQLYEATDRPAEAAKWRKELEAVKKQ